MRQSQAAFVLATAVMAIGSLNLGFLATAVAQDKGGFQYTPLDAGRDAYVRQQARREGNINRQIGVNDYVRWLANLPDRSPFGLALPRGQSQIYGPGSYIDGNTVFEPYGSMPPYAGIPYAPRVEQPTGYETIFKKNGGYYFGPTYDRPEPAPPVALAPPPRNAERRFLEPVGSPQFVPEDPAAREENAFGDEQQLANLRGLFAAGNYEQVLKQAGQMPASEEGLLLQVHALAALGEFTEAGDLLDGILPKLPPESWGLVITNHRAYFGTSVRYTRHLRALEAFVAQQPDAWPARLLLGYEYGYLGFKDEALKQLAISSKLAPQGKSAGLLLNQFGAAAPAKALPAAPVGRAF